MNKHADDIPGPKVIYQHFGFLGHQTDVRTDYAFIPHISTRVVTSEIKTNQQENMIGNGYENSTTALGKVG
ncbi:hypothetical protein N7524_007079 [Penicillium chrysogenum]|nr:hypothetical protein N7524_007079 [Penicillium chrysogenum]